MDQVKEILRQAIKYRFWIVVGIAALLPVIAYFSSGAMADETKKAADDAIGAEKQVRGFTSGTIPNAPYKEAVETQTAALTKDVNASWRKLYERQAPLLRWPEAVDEQFTTWTRKWPEGVAPNVINNTIEDYLRTYPKYVEQVYSTVKPFDYEEGTGIVVAPPKEVLMRPAPFDPDQPTLPGLGKVWAAQERLWIQNTVLDVIAKVNEKVGAKDWDSAAVKQVNTMEVASPAAQDQRSVADGKELEPAPDITDPSKPVEEAAEETAAAPGQADMMKMMGGSSMMGSMMGSGGMSGAQGASEEVYYLKSENPDQYRVVPIYLSVLIEQSRVPDLLVEFQNSPMSIQVLEFALMRPSARVHKPVKGEAPQGMMGSGMMGMMGMMMGSSERIMGGMRGMGGYGDMMQMMGGGMSSEMMQSQMSGMMPGYGMMGGMATQPARKGELIQKNVERGKRKGKDEEKKEEKPYEPKIADPYFNVIELRVYGQARFYMPPPAEEAEPASESESAATADATTGEPAAADNPAADNPAADAAAEPAKVQADPGETKSETPKAEASEPETPPAAGEPAADEPKADETKAEDAAPRR